MENTEWTAVINNLLQSQIIATNPEGITPARSISDHG